MPCLLDIKVIPETAAIEDWYDMVHDMTIKDCRTVLVRFMYDKQIEAQPFMHTSPIESEDGWSFTVRMPRNKVGEIKKCASD